MNDKSNLVFIEHILESINKIEEYSKNLSKDKLIENTEIQDAIIRRIEIIGEAVKNLPNNFRNKYPDIEWNEIIRTRDKIIHHYFGINLDIVWGIIKKDLPDLKIKILKIKEDLTKS